ncbi:ABC transporter permease [Cytobacillus praedii]|uniref:ABC transporter permease n=1 Tax=Cytobacillus praedii TaxID=1742358 RepID=UPI002E1B13AA|nr:ABC transporter permease subunit [Cytobacillus praedii]MED3572141.1 ABC transporter permease [Cytobacillus praedii]
MNQWMTLLNKELLEMTRNFKWIWVPIVFILIAVMEPITAYYMPQIIDSLGNLPDGAVIELPMPSAEEVLVASLSQYNTLGLLVIILSSMGIIAGERKSGVAGLILVKPVSYTAFVTAKWAGAMLLLWISYFIGYFVSWYYVGILFDMVPFIDFIQSFFIYGLWLSFVLTITVFFNSFLKSPGAVGFLSFAAVIILIVISGTFSKWVEWSPAQLLSYASTFIMSGSNSSDVWSAIILSVFGIIMLLGGSIAIFRRRELA